MVGHSDREGTADMHLHMRSYLLLLSFAAVAVAHAEPQAATEGETGPQIVERAGYTLQYNEQHEQPGWVAYTITDDELTGTWERTDDYRADPTISTGSASLSDYRGSGFDRGHLAPAAAMKWSPQAMSESFYLSNISPQVAGFNRGIWRVLEEQVRSWARQNEEVHVVTGPVLRDGLPTIGPNGVSVPEYFYKVVLDYTEPDLKAIGFILPNQPAAPSFAQFAVPVDHVEQVTGIDFFPGLPDEVEDVLESSCEVANWGVSAEVDWDATGTDQRSGAAQCLGVTKAGRQCRRTTTNENGYCWQHQDQAGEWTDDENSTVPATPVTPGADEATVYRTRTGTKYHVGTCRYLSSSRIAIKLSDAKAAGLGPCSVCRPPK